MKKTIKHQFSFPHSPEMVWEYLTKPELMDLWLMKNNFQPVLGADFEFRTSASPNLNFDGVFYCKVLEIVPLKKLSYSWNSGPAEGEITLNSVVVWQLQATATGTELFLEHSGFEGEENLDMYNALNNGWVGKFPKIANLISTAQHANTNA